MTFCLEVIPQSSGLFNTQRSSSAVRADDSNAGELMGFHDTKAYAGVLFDFLLQILGKLLVALHRNDGQGIHIETADALTLLVDTQT